MNNIFIKNTLVCIIALLLVTINIFGQSPNIIFNSNQSTLYLQPAFSNLKNNSNPKYLESIPSLDFGVGYNYIFALGNFYGIGVGTAIGYINYKIEPSAPSNKIYCTSSNILNIHVPVYFIRYYPFNNKIALCVKTGLNLSKLFSSLSNFGGVEIDGFRLYSTNAVIKPTPQIGILFELGGTYCFKNNNFISVGLVVNKNFINTVKVNYEYFENALDTPKVGSFESTASSIGLSIGYHFRFISNEKN